MINRGYAAVGLHMPKTPENVGSALRAAGCYGAAMLATTGKRFPAGCTDTNKAWRHLPYLRLADADALCKVVPYGAVPVAVDLLDTATSLVRYQHPQRAFYIFGPEDGTLGESILSWCRDYVYVPTTHCMNLAATVNVVLYDRMAKQQRSLTHGTR